MLEQHFRGMVPVVELPNCRPPAGYVSLTILCFQGTRSDLRGTCKPAAGAVSWLQAFGVICIGAACHQTLQSGLHASSQTPQKQGKHTRFFCCNAACHRWLQPLEELQSTKGHG